MALDNEKRASRLQQLVDSMANLQTDVKDLAAKMDKRNEEYRPAIDKLLKANGMDSVDDVIDKAAAEMTAEERKAFEAVCCLFFCSVGGDDWCNQLMPRYGQLIKAVKESKAVGPPWSRRSVLRAK